LFREGGFNRLAGGEGANPKEGILRRTQKSLLGLFQRKAKINPEGENMKGLGEGSAPAKGRFQSGKKGLSREDLAKKGSEGVRPHMGSPEPLETCHLFEQMVGNGNGKWLAYGEGRKEAIVFSIMEMTLLTRKGEGCDKEHKEEAIVGVAVRNVFLVGGKSPLSKRGRNTRKYINPRVEEGGVVRIEGGLPLPHSLLQGGVGPRKKKTNVGKRVPAWGGGV